MKTWKKSAGIALIFLLAISVLSFAGGQGEKVAEAKFKIGIAFDVGGRGDKSFNDSAYAGLVHLAKDFKGYIAGDPDNVDFGKETELKYLEPKSGGQDREQLLRILAEDGYNLVIGVGFMYSDALGKVAKDFPNVHFAIIDGWLPDLTETSNITCLGFTEHEGSFLVGAIAGLKNKKLGGKLGFIGGMDMPLIHKFHAGFYAGSVINDGSALVVHVYGNALTCFGIIKGRTVFAAVLSQKHAIF
ncbi:MAG: BMP family ABC transporter substrate-binding protein, partial [Spirochaeta sp.]|nr:BMP family ABC transporter substrate-binding protein [Spirochaeta sp.]